MHSHPHNHLFIVTSGEARVEYKDETVIIHENEAFVVEGSRFQERILPPPSLQKTRGWMSMFYDMFHIDKRL